MNFIQYSENNNFINSKYKNNPSVEVFLKTICESSDFNVFYDIELCVYTLYLIENGSSSEKTFFLNYVENNIINTYINTIIYLTEKNYFKEDEEFFFRHIIKNNLFEKFSLFLKSNNIIYEKLIDKLKNVSLSESFIDNVELYFSHKNTSCLYDFIFDFMIYTKTNPFALSYVIVKQSHKKQYLILKQLGSFYKEKIAEIVFSNRIRFNHFFNILKFEEFHFFFEVLCKIINKFSHHIIKNNDFIISNINNQIRKRIVVYKNKKEQKNTIRISLFFLFSKEILSNTGKINTFSIIRPENLKLAIDNYITHDVLNNIPEIIRKFTIINLFDFLNFHEKISKYYGYYQGLVIIPSSLSQEYNKTNLIIYNKDKNIYINGDYNLYECLNSSLMILNNFSDPERVISDLKLNLFSNCDLNTFSETNLLKILDVLKCIGNSGTLMFNQQSLYYDIDRVIDAINMKKIHLSVTKTNKGRI